MASPPSALRPGEAMPDALTAQLLLSLYYGAQYPPGFMERWIQIHGLAIDLEMPCMVIRAWTGQEEVPLKEGWIASADSAVRWFSFAGREEWIAMGLCSRPCTQARCMAMAQAFLAAVQEAPHAPGRFPGDRRILFYPSVHALSKLPDPGIQLEERAVAHPAINRAMTYLHTAYASDFALSDLSRHCGMTESYLCKLFKQNTGITLTEYLCRLRMEKAKALLREGQYRVCQIGPMVGYKNPAYFHRLFKQRERLTPIEYRMRERYASANSE
ncbi:MAG TPA: AraC family transcriptional regulator [Clostridia bacterium]|nr:AraC family transcriptional regulator [Clostridia bacterium]